MGRAARTARGLIGPAGLWFPHQTEPAQGRAENYPRFLALHQSPCASLVRFISQRAAESGAFAGSPAQFSGETDWVAEEPVSSEPVSAADFPANRENNREYRKIGG